MERVLFKKVELWLVVLVVLLGIGAGGVWAFAVLERQAFPYGPLAELRGFIRGDPADPRSLWTRLKAEFVYDPRAFAAWSDNAVVAADRLSPVRLAPGAATATLPPVEGIRYFDAGGPRRYFVLFGSFVFPEQQTHWGAVLVDSKGAIHRGWAIRPERHEFLGGHIGLAVTDAGVIATNTGGVLTGYDWCGGKRWEAEWSPEPGHRPHHDAADSYDWHHDIVAHEGVLYTFRGSSVMLVDAATGRVRSEIHAADLIRWGWRDDIDIFTARREHTLNTDTLSKENLVDLFYFDPFHFNKVDVLSAELAAQYPQFEAGDLLLSLRELNLVTVVRPGEERVVWWRYGLFSRQHDATFIDGHIEVFDNNPVSVPPRPRLIRLDLEEQQAETLLDLSRWGFVMRTKGNFERDGERVLTVDDESGRAVAGRLDGSIDFVFKNGWRDPEGEVVPLQLRNATELAPAEVAAFEDHCRNDTAFRFR